MEINLDTEDTGEILEDDVGYPIATLIYADGSQEEFLIFPGSHWGEQIQRARKEAGEIQRRQLGLLSRTEMIYRETLPPAPDDQARPRQKLFREGDHVTTRDGIAGVIWWKRDEMILLKIEGQPGYCPVDLSELI